VVVQWIWLAVKGPGVRSLLPQSLESHRDYTLAFQNNNKKNKKGTSNNNADDNAHADSKYVKIC